MSLDEIFVLVVAGIISAVWWGRWIRPAWRLLSFQRPDVSDTLGVFAPLAALALLLVVLRTGASHDVRDDAIYLVFYFLLGTAWLALTAEAARLLGYEWRDDVIERSNPAAALAWGGAAIGHTLAFGGGNLGDGPGWWVVVFCGGLASGTVFAAWFAYDRTTHAFEQVTIERSPAAGLRLGGLLLAAGLVAGRAVAGDWTDAGATLYDWARVAWPVAGLTALAIGLDRVLCEPATAEPAARTNFGPWIGGLVPAGIYLCLAILWLFRVGPW